MQSMPAYQIVLLIILTKICQFWGTYSVNASVPAPHLCQTTPLSCYEKVSHAMRRFTYQMKPICLEIYARLLYSHDSHVRTWFPSTYQMKALSMPWNTQQTLQPCFEEKTQRKCKPIKTGTSWVCQWNTLQILRTNTIHTHNKLQKQILRLEQSEPQNFFVHFLFSLCFSFSFFPAWMSFIQLTRPCISMNFSVS